MYFDSNLSGGEQIKYCAKEILPQASYLPDKSLRQQVFPSGLQ